MPLCFQVQYSYYNPQQSMNEQRYIVTEIELGQYSDPGLFNCAVDRIQVTETFLF